ncbi:4a-hydroxytetrahydrobiopterin dehydratase [Estrella lausannensis]|uniref:Putative pterin-4-alpha-carbinolamine dehydratase n=1 Tax=Estrella lausannensis TaxID=483423 RepID=A0A0H5DQ92_9BACT|nr:4a-hydroxytetrahydrobiopterin dehydratase [Estrella lausannensis]CRX38672.1 Putative pterin-4-alpha-carbinolamine dehydratase [Estrella lausannensis]
MKEKHCPLHEKKCVPCQGGVPPLEGHRVHELIKELSPGWKADTEQHLHKEWHFRDFKEAWRFVDRISEIAEGEGHHPDIYLSWGKVAVTLWTHKINGLTESDFILAAKYDKAFDNSSKGS